MKTYESRRQLEQFYSWSRVFLIIATKYFDIFFFLPVPVIQMGILRQQTSG